MLADWVELWGEESDCSWGKRIDVTTLRSVPKRTAVVQQRSGYNRATMTSALARQVVVMALCVVMGPRLLVAQTAGTAAVQAQAHDKAFWQAVAASKFAVLTGAALPALLDELTALLGSPDSDLRDDIAYSALTQWIYLQRIVPVDERRRLLREWSLNLARGIGDQGSPSVLRRSFSALALGMLAILDNEAPYLDQEEFDRLLTVTLRYLKDERDVRGFDPAVGWMHSVAHTADLIKFLARSRHLRPEQQATILSGISGKLRSTHTVLINGEDERLARAVLSIVARPDVDATGFAGWVKSLAAPERPGPPTVQDLAVDQNIRHLVVSMFAVISADTRDLPQIVQTRAVLLAHLQGQ